MKRIVVAAVLGAFVATVFGQDRAKPPAFETASIKLSKTTEGSDSDSTPGYFRGSGTLKAFIRMAYGVSNEQIDGGPKWLDQDRYDIEARADSPAQGPQLMEMLQTLLGERCKLEFHRENKVFSGYALVVAKNGLKITDVPPGDSHSMNGGRGSLIGQNVTLSRLATNLSRVLATPVANETGNSGVFDFKLTWAPEATSPSATARDENLNGPSLFTALQEQLGLRLESRKVSVEVLILDHVDKPTQN